MSNGSKIERPKKPYSDFPLGPHPSGAWQKRIRGKLHYFGRWAKRVKGELERIPGDGWEEALKLYQAQAPDLHAGRIPRVAGSTDGLELSALCNRFLTAKTRKLKSGELGQRMFNEYKATTDLLIKQFGSKRLVSDLASDDFESLRAVMAERWGPVRLGNEITRVKSLFKYGYDGGLITQVMRYGSEFAKPNRKVLRKHRADKGNKMLEADQLRLLLDVAPVHLKAMILLGLNCGFGNHDCATLPQSKVNLETGWVEFARGKTGIERRCPLWDETIKSIRESIVERPECRQESAQNLLFLTGRGRQCLSGGVAYPVTSAMAKLLKDNGLHRSGLGFYSLRHVFRTIADGCKDQVAINSLMGHSDSTMGGIYRERIDDSRLIAVSQHVHDWLFGTDNDGSREPQEVRANSPSTRNRFSGSYSRIRPRRYASTEAF